jgi:hypothetical protein
VVSGEWYWWWVVFVVRGVGGEWGGRGGGGGSSTRRSRSNSSGSKDRVDDITGRGQIWDESYKTHTLICLCVLRMYDVDHVCMYVGIYMYVRIRTSRCTSFVASCSVCDCKLRGPSNIHQGLTLKMQWKCDINVNPLRSDSFIIQNKRDE